jgi:hypothetical protein
MAADSQSPCQCAVPRQSASRRAQRIGFSAVTSSRFVCVEDVFFSGSPALCALFWCTCKSKGGF